MKKNAKDDKPFTLNAHVRERLTLKKKDHQDVTFSSREQILIKQH